MAQIFYEPLARVFTNTGEVGAGYKYYFYTTGTTTPITTYSDSTLSTPNTWPVVADANGRFGPIWVSNLTTTKSILKTAADVTIETVDPVGATASNTSLNDLDVRPTSYWGLTSGTSTAYVLAANPSVPAYSNVQTFFFQPHIANGVNPTIAISGLGALNLKKYTGQGAKIALEVGDLQATERYTAICDGVDIVILDPRNKNTYYGTNQPLTIAIGVVPITNAGSIYAIDTEGSAATDDLDTINGGNQGQFIILGNTDAARSVVLKHNTGNIFNPGGIDITLSATTDRVTMTYDSTLAKWIVIGVNAAGSTPIQLLQTQTVSSSLAELAFTTQINSIFSKYVFEFINIIPATNGKGFQAQYSIDGGATYVSSNYLGTNLSNTTADAAGSYVNSASVINFCGNYAADANWGMTNASNKGLCGQMTLWNPSSTAVNKQISYEGIGYTTLGSTYANVVSGNSILNNSTTAINAIKFFFDSGNIASGTIKMYGVL